MSQERKGTIAVSLTNFLDSGCIVASGAALSTWALAFNFGSQMTAVIGAIGANAFGAAVGALIGGFLTDRFGRKFIYTYNLLVYAVGAFLCMICFNLPMLLVGIVLLGLSVGAGVPASWSYISEMSGSTRRAQNVGISQFAWSCGPAIIFALTLLCSLIVPATTNVNGVETLLPSGTYGPFDGLFGMRFVFGILFAVSLVAWGLQRQLKESKDWEKQQKSDKSINNRNSFGKMLSQTFKNSTVIKTMLFLVFVYLTWNIVCGTMGQFMPYLYQAAGNLDATQTSLLQMVMWILTAIFSILIFSALGDRVPHRLLYFLTSALAVIAWIVMVFFGYQLAQGTADQYGWLLWVFVACWGVSAGFSAQCFYALWSTELFPTKFRGGAQGVMFFLVRGILGLWSLFCIGGLGVETPEGFITAGIIMVFFLIVSLLVGTIGCPQTQGKTLDEITKRIYGDKY